MIRRALSPASCHTMWNAIPSASRAAARDRSARRCARPAEPGPARRSSGSAPEPRRPARARGSRRPPRRRAAVGAAAGTGRPARGRADALRRLGEERPGGGLLMARWAFTDEEFRRARARVRTWGVRGSEALLVGLIAVLPLALTLWVLWLVLQV